MFRPSTHTGLAEAVIETLIQRKGDDLLRFGLNAAEAREVVGYLFARERVRRAGPSRTPRDPRSVSARKPEVTEKERRLAQTPPVSVERIRPIASDLWDAIDEAWDLLRDDLACERVTAHVFMGSAGMAPLLPAYWMDRQSDDAHIFGTMSYAMNCFDVGEAPIWLAREGLEPSTDPIVRASSSASVDQGTASEAPVKSGRSTPRSDYAAELINRAFGKAWPAPGDHKPGEVFSLVLAKIQPTDRQVAPSRKTVLKRLGWQDG